MGDDEASKHEDKEQHDPSESESQCDGSTYPRNEPEHSTRLLLDEEQDQELLEEPACLGCVPRHVVGHACENPALENRHRDAQQHHRHRISPCWCKQHVTLAD